jgi:transposase
VVGVEQLAEVRRMKRVEGLSAREIGRRTGLARDTVARLLAAEAPPRYSRARAGSILDPFKDWICEQLQADPRVPSQRLRELALEIGYTGGKTVFDAYVREVRPRFLVKRTFQRTVYRPAELIQCDLWEPSRHIPVGYGQTRRGWVVTCQSCWSRAFAGTLIFSKEAPDILAGLARNLKRLGVGAEKLVWDRESAIAGRGKPSEPFLAFCGQLSVGWIILDAGDAQAKGQLERQHRFLRSNFEPRRSFANHLDFQDQLDRWAEKANGRAHRTIRGVPAERLAHERELRPLGKVTLETDRRWVARVPQQPLIRIDRNDYSLDPVFAGRRVEIRVSQREITATVLDTGELAAQHTRIFAGFQTIVDPAHQNELEAQREWRRERHQVEVEWTRFRGQLWALVARFPLLL